jgi:hypothetical protein
VLQSVLQALDRHGLLLLSDARLPSVAGLVAGERVRGSWWGHPKGKTIYAVATGLEDDEGVTIARLVDGKVTYVHRRLWPALAAVACSDEPWQKRALSPAARTLLAAVERAGELRTDHRGDGSLRKEAVLQLEQRLLVRSDEVHTESGAHAKRLEAWTRWADRHVPPSARPPVEAARRQLEQAVESLGGGASLPWHDVARRRRR